MTKTITKLERSFLSVETNKVLGGKGRVRWDIVCQPTAPGGCGILNIKNIPRVLRLRWPWLEWTDPSRAWVGMGTPCDAEDMDFLYKCITINVEDGMKTKFGMAHGSMVQSQRILPLKF